MFLYTDGIVEATNTNEKLYGMDRLKETLAGIESRDTKDVIDIVKESVNKFSEGTEQYDDITMLCFKFKELKSDRNLIYNFEKDFDAVNDSIEDINDFVSDSLSKVYEGNDAVYSEYLNKIFICCEEIAANIIDHAYEGMEGDNKIKVKLLIDKNVDKISISFIDKGAEFNPTVQIEPNVLKDIDNRKSGGLGIYIAKRTMDIMDYKRENNENILTITKYF